MIDTVTAGFLMAACLMVGGFFGLLAGACMSLAKASDEAAGVE